MAAAEFHVEGAFAGDRRTPVRWVWSHVARHKWPLFWLFSGALTNAAFAAAVPVFIGMAFNAVLQSPPDYGAVARAAIWILVTQFVRSAWQMGRNFSSEVIGQRLERDARAELYASLLGKSMTFHSLRPVGEIMARATNDVRALGQMLNPGINLIVGSMMFVFMPLLVAPTIPPQLVLGARPYLLASLWALKQIAREP
jgi:ATP-binding cassette subfamily B protein